MFGEKRFLLLIPGQLISKESDLWTQIGTHFRIYRVYNSLSDDEKNV